MLAEAEVEEDVGLHDVMKTKGKFLEVGQGREAGGHRVRLNVPGNITKVKFNKVSGRQK